MKNAIIFHGTGCTPNSYWFPKTKDFLENLGYDVWVPQLPDADNPVLSKWLPVALSGKYNEETIIIGHSAGGPLVLSVLENINVTIHKAVMVAGFARKLRGDKETQPILQPEYNWDKIKKAAKDIIYINSQDDPWTIDQEEGLYMWKKTGGTLICREGEGHMGSDSFHQPYTSFPLLEKLLEVKYTRSSIDGSDKL
ncbi:MAG TPA: alpha/beta hydrolase [Spirochaetia bacterium]|nr:alpha/beta hydrolase [Spirochaetia bacterium]